MLSIPGFSSTTGGFILNLLRLLRFVRLPRAFRMLYSFCLLVLLHVPRMLRSVVNAITVFYFNFLFFIAVLVNAIACLWCVVIVHCLPSTAVKMAMRWPMVKACCIADDTDGNQPAALYMPSPAAAV